MKTGRNKTFKFRQIQRNAPKRNEPPLAVEGKAPPTPWGRGWEGAGPAGAGPAGRPMGTNGVVCSQGSSRPSWVSRSPLNPPSSAKAAAAAATKLPKRGFFPPFQASGRRRSVRSELPARGEATVTKSAISLSKPGNWGICRVLKF